MSKYQIPDDNPAKKYTNIEPNDSASDIVQKLFTASGENLHNIPNDINDGCEASYNDGYTDGKKDGYNDGQKDGIEYTAKMLGIVIPVIIGATAWITAKGIPMAKEKYANHKAKKQLQATVGQTRQLPTPSDDPNDDEPDEEK